MNPLEYEIKANKKPNKLTRNLLMPHEYGDSLPHEYDFDSLINAYRSWVYIAVTKNAMAVASQKLRLYVAKESKSKIRGYKTRELETHEINKLKSFSSTSNIPAVRKAARVDEVLDHPFIDLIQNVNPHMNMFDLFELTTLHKDLTGNSYWYILDNKLGVPKEIWPVMPQHIKIIPDPKKFISGYEYIKNNSEGLWSSGSIQGIKFSDKEMIHHKHISPRNMFYGASPIYAIKDAYNTGQSMYTYENAIFANMGRLDGTFETEEDLNEFEFLRLKEEIKQMFTGAGNAGKAPLLSNGVSYKPYGLPPKEMSHLQGRKSIKEEIVNSLGQSLGMYDKDATRANSDSALYAFMRDATRPRLMKLEQKVNEQLINRYDSRLFVAFDDPVPEDKEFELNRRTKEAQAGTSSINEEREKLNRRPIEGLDDPLIPVNLQTIQTLINNANPENSKIAEASERAIHDALTKR